MSKHTFPILEMSYCIRMLLIFGVKEVELRREELCYVVLHCISAAWCGGTWRFMGSCRWAYRQVTITIAHNEG